MLDGVEDGLGAIVDLELLENVVDVGFNGGFANDQVIGDTAVGNAFGKKL